MRYVRLLVVLVLLASLLPRHVAAAPPKPPRQLASLPGQVDVVTVNAKQNRVLGLKRFLALFELPKALRFRPKAFNGGFAGAVAAPDVIIVQEVRPSNLEIFVRLLRQRFPYKYQSLEPLDAAAAFVVNTDTVALQGEVTTWADVCTTVDTPTDKRPTRDYPIARFTEVATNAPFVVAGMHIAKRYDTTGQQGCVPRNMETLRAELAGETAPVVIGGDFNRRATVDPFECDRDEEGTPNGWYQVLVSPPEGETVYADAVRQWHRARGTSMEHEWTHEQRQSAVLCDQTTHFKRSRIDYLFSSAVVAEAHADHPGWAGAEPGTSHRSNGRYSDHRYVWGRFVVSGPPRMLRPSAVPVQGGRVDLAWQPVEGATGYVVYRARRGRAYDILATLGADALTFADAFTEHGHSYRYALAPVGADGGIGHESRPAFATADARGPRVRRVAPLRNATAVDPRAVVTVRYDERVAAASITVDTIKVFRESRRVAGTLAVAGPRLLTFDPFGRLEKGKTYRVEVASVRDARGNAGPRASWEFRTVEPPPKRPRR